MGSRRTSIFENGLIWFGAGVSLAEILTGTYFASLGFSTGLLAIIIGHIIGCGMMFFAGFIGGKTRKSAMETVKMSFGSTGALLFAVLNILQLVGWTAIMIYDGSLAAAGIFNIANWVWPVIIGGLIIIWILVGIENLGKINTVAMAALFILTLVLSFIIFGHGSLKPVANDGLTFGAAVELAVAMPLSWLPLISDYTREAKEPTKATWASVIVYGLVSCWMYVIGMGISIFTGESDIAQIMVKAGLGIAGLLTAVELAVAMPLSWLPLISDYTREAKEPTKATWASVIVYGLVSCWMYVIGMGISIFTGESDIAQIMVKAGLGIAGLLIIVFSTVTTTFLDAWSAGISSESLSKNINGKWIAVAATVIGMIGAIVYPMDDITDFLYLIGSVFAPMIAVQIADFFILHQDFSRKSVCIQNMIVWVVGFIAYRWLMGVDTILGNTLPDMVITIVLSVIVSLLFGKKND